MMFIIEYPPNHIFEVFSIDWEWNQEHKTISNFPKEIMDIVMEYLPKRSILALMSTCRDLHRTCISYLFQNHKMCFSYEYRKDNIFHSTVAPEYPRIVDIIDKYPESINLIERLVLYSAQDYPKTYLENTASKLKRLFKRTYNEKNGLLSEAKLYNTLPTMKNIEYLKICITNHKTLHKLSTSIPPNLYFLMIDLKLDTNDLGINKLKPLTLSVYPLNMQLLKITNKGRKPMVFGAQKSIETIRRLFASTDYDPLDDLQQEEIIYVLHKEGSTNTFFQCGKIIANILSRASKSLTTVQINGIAAEMIFLHCETHINYKRLELINLDWLSIPLIESWIKFVEQRNSDIRHVHLDAFLPLIINIKVPSAAGKTTQDTMFRFAGYNPHVWHNIEQYDSEFWLKFIDSLTDRFTEAQDELDGTTD